MSKVNIEERVKQYVSIRDKIRDMEEKHKEELAPYKQVLEGLNSVLLKHLLAVGGDSVRTAAGTVYRSERASATIADAEAFMDYVIKNNEFSLLDKRANKTAVADFVKDNNRAPPGVNYSVMHVVGVRRS